MNWRNLASGLAVAIAAGAVGHAQLPPQPVQAPQSIFRSAVDLVTVDVTVLDSTGRPARDLTTPDFSLTVDGKPRRISNAQFISHELRASAPGLLEPRVTPFSTNDGVTGGRLLMFVVDSGNIIRSTPAMYGKVVEKFLSRLGPGDRVGLAVLPGGIRVNFTPFHALVRDAIAKTMGTGEGANRTPRVGLSEAIAIDRLDQSVLTEVASRVCVGFEDGPQTAQCIADIKTESAAIVRNSVSQAQNSLTSLRALLTRLADIDAPKTLIILSEGLVVDRRFDAVSWMRDETASARTSIYSLRIIPALVDAAQDQINHTAGLDNDIGARGLEWLTGQASGTVFTVMGTGDEAFNRLSTELTGFYLLGFEPEPSDRDGRSHAIDVKVFRPGVQVRSRQVFVAPALAAKPTDQDIVASMLRDPLLAGDIPLSVTTHNYKDPQSEQVKVLVSAAIGRGAIVPNVGAVGLAVTNDAADVRVFSIDPPPKSGEQYIGAVLLEPGVYTLKVAVVDDQGRRASVEHRFQAKLGAGGPFRFGDLMLTDGMLGQALRPRIDPRISRDSLLGYTELYASDAARFERATVAFEVANDPNAPALAQAPGVLAATAVPGRWVAQGMVPLAGLKPGNYVLRAVVAISGSRVARLLCPFELIAQHPAATRH